MRGSELRCLLALLALGATPALADWKQDYARGLEAAKDGHWDEVDRYMHSAIAGNPKPAERVRLYGQRYEAYAPQHYAGLAALRLGDCSKALVLWSQGDNVAVVSSVSTLSDEENQGRVECSSRLVRQGTTPKSETHVAPPAQSPPIEPVPARPEAPPPSRPVVQALPPTRPPATEPRESSSVSAQILRPLVDAYLSGRYADVLKLSSQIPPTPRLRWHMLTLRAAAAFNLGQLGQMPEADGIARKAVEQARAADAALKPDADYFSPRFIRYYNSR
ncbi:MAG: hypothetical protein IPP82_03970 [Xanthomonadales bacterium]|nr:hypothetical protein [Xanthomonadales bacterium]